MTRLTDTELEAYAVHAAATQDVPLLSLVTELQEARRLLVLAAEAAVRPPEAPEPPRRRPRLLRPKGTSE